MHFGEGADNLAAVLAKAKASGAGPQEAEDTLPVLEDV